MKDDFLIRYKQALDQQFYVERQVFSWNELGDYIVGLKEHECIVAVTEGVKAPDRIEGHAVSIVKDKDGYYIYDPNDSEYQMGFMEKRSAKEVQTVLGSTGADLKNYGLKGKKAFNFEKLDISLAMAQASSGIGSEILEAAEIELGGILRHKDEVKPIAQNRVVELVAAYFNTVYKPKVPMEAKGVCYGLSVMLRELLVQTGSIRHASNLLYLSLYQIAQCEKELTILDETQPLSDEIIASLKENQLVLSMIPLFHSLQRVEIPDTRYQIPVFKVIGVIWNM